MVENKREVVVFNDKSHSLDSAKSLAENLKSSGLFERVFVFTRDGSCQEDSSTKVIPDTCDTLAKARNFINEWFKKENFGGFLHVVEDGLELKSTLALFVNSIEKMMDVLDYDVWFNTVCDPCNYVYSKFNPRISVAIDREETKPLGLSSKIMFTSHSNTAWVCYNFSKASDDLLKFNEQFDIPMFMIIEYLARRRNTKSAGQLYFMNMYATIPEEVGAFKTSSNARGEDEMPTPPEKMAAEDKIFRELGVNFAPDNNIDEVLEALWAKLKSKMN